MATAEQIDEITQNVTEDKIKHYAHIIRPPENPEIFAICTAWAMTILVLGILSIMLARTGWKCRRSAHIGLSLDGTLSPTMPARSVWT